MEFSSESVMQVQLQGVEWSTEELLSNRPIWTWGGPQNVSLLINCQNSPNKQVWGAELPVLVPATHQRLAVIR